MKKNPMLNKALIVFFVLLTSFIPLKDETKKAIATPAPFCSCGIPGSPFGQRSGSTVTLSWDPVAGAICYSYGGTYTSGGGFSGTTSGTSVVINLNGGGIFQVRAICEGTCTNATCSSATTSPTGF